MSKKEKFGCRACGQAFNVKRKTKAQNKIYHNKCNY